MTFLIAGVLLWVAAHLIPTLATGLRQGLIDKLGDGPYRGIFTLIVLTSLGLIVFGWRMTPEEYLYVLPLWSRHAGFVLMMISIYLFAVSHGKSVVKSFVRHPMLMAVFLWSLNHLLTNGTTRALILFGGLGLWALIEMPLINAREGARELPPAPGLKSELIVLAISTVVLWACWPCTRISQVYRHCQCERAQ